jgi:hypothetical protein
VKEMAKARRQSISATLVELTVLGLSQLDVAAKITRDERSGFPVLSVGHRVTSADVTAALTDQ